MRKMLMRICRDVESPGGPCALEGSTGTRDKVTGATLETGTGVLRATERLTASDALNETSLEFVRECTAQCEHGLVGWPKAKASPLG